MLDTVEQAGANPCPPIVLGIGIGGSFDHCAALAKKALLRPLNEPNATRIMLRWKKSCWTPSTRPALARRLWRCHDLSGVAIEQKPTHVACLPVAVNISCHVTRRASREV